MIKNVCIVTNFNNSGNYGAVLQAFALNKTIRDFGISCNTLSFNLYEQNGSKTRRYLKRVEKFEIKGFFEDLNRDVGRLIVSKKINLRKKSLELFKNSIPHTKIYAYDELDELSKEYDCFICGSDQIWRPTYQGELVGIYWLKQIKGDVVKASYSASIGLDQLPKSLWDEARVFLDDFDYIAVREEQAKKFLTDICDKDIIVTVDPVFLLSQNKWRSLGVRPQIDEEYLFVYMIHGTKELIKSIERFAKKMNLKIVIFPFMSYRFKIIECKIGDYRIFDASPEDFLGLIDNAKYVFTDSFHVTAFSILFQKNFFTSSANGLALSRIKNLLEKCGLADRLIPATGLSEEEYLSITHSDWSNVEKLLREEIDKSVRYLRNVLDLKD